MSIATIPIARVLAATAATNTSGMSRHASRVSFLRQQVADLRHWVANPPNRRAHRTNKKTRDNLARVENILRDLGAMLIGGIPS